MNTFTLGACFQHELHTGPYFMTFALRLIILDLKFWGLVRWFKENIVTDWTKA